MSRDAAAAPLAYVADTGDNVVDVYSAKSYKLIGQIENWVGGPAGLATDHHGNLYVADAGCSGPTCYQNVAIYSKGLVWPKEVLNDTAPPSSIAVAKDNTVYVSVGSGVDVFPNRAPNPAYTITDPSFKTMLGVAVDADGNLYVSGVSAAGGGQVSVFSPSSRGPGVNLNLKALASPLSLLVEKNGDLVVGDNDLSAIDVFPPKATAASLIIHVAEVGYVAQDPARTTVFWAPALAGTTISALTKSTTLKAITVAGASVQLGGVAFGDVADGQ